MAEPWRSAPPEVDAELEQAIRARGHELLERLRAAGGESLRRDAITDRITRWAMADPRLKAQLFRFIDVLPVLRSSDEVARHVREYLLRPGLRLPPGAAALLRASAYSRALAGMVAMAARTGAHQMARRFIAGANIQEAERTIRRLRRAGMGYTVDILGEAVTSEAEAQAYQARYLALLVALAEKTGDRGRETGGAGEWESGGVGDGETRRRGEGATGGAGEWGSGGVGDGETGGRGDAETQRTGARGEGAGTRSPVHPFTRSGLRSPVSGPLSPEVNVSLKLSALYSRFDPLDAEGTAAAVKERLRPIMAQAREVGAYVHVDMEQYAFKDLTLRIFREILMEEGLRDWPHTGIVIQAYLRDAERDLHELRDWARERGTPVWVRLVKGAYWDYETVIAAQHGWPVPVFARKWETDASFERLTRYLLENRLWLRPAIGSHNVRSVTHALALAERLRLPPQTVEYQVLYGMGDRLGQVLAARGEQVRVYVPYGELLPGMAYLVRRLLENTSNESFLRHSFVENLPEEELLGNPAEESGGVGEWGSGRRGDAATRRRGEEGSGGVGEWGSGRRGDAAARRRGAEGSGGVGEWGSGGVGDEDAGAGRAAGRDEAELTAGMAVAGSAGGTAPALELAAGESMPPLPHSHTPIPPLSHTPGFTNEPETDFSQAGSRERMREAIARVRGQLGLRCPLIIDGRRVETESVLERPNPSCTSEVIGRACLAGPAEAECAVAAARVAFPDWRDTPAEDRARLLFRTAEVLRRRRFELAAWEILEVGKPWREADADVAEAIDFLEYYGREMLRLAPPRRRDIPGERNEYFYEGRGVAAVIAPWNFPLAILTGMSAAALVAGNTVIMKPAEQSSVVAYQLMEAFREAGAPHGVLHYLPGRGEEVGAALVEHPDVSLIAFTGSKEVGLGIQLEAARVRPGQRDTKRVIAEMGGKNAIIVDDDADLDEAVPGVMASAFGYQGQKCSACSRVVVLEGIYDAFVSRLVEAARSARVGPAEDPGTTVGPVVDLEARNRVLRYLYIGREEGRVVAEVDPGPLAREGYFVPLTIFAGVDPQACIAQEEIFGPVLAVLRVRDFDEALDVANGTLYALTGGLYSRSPAHIARARREFRAGNLYINRKITGARVDLQPFGGYRMSGIGSKAGGPDYLLQFLVPRTITESTLRRGFAAEDE